MDEAFKVVFMIFGINLLIIFYPLLLLPLKKLWKKVNLKRESVKACMSDGSMEREINLNYSPAFISLLIDRKIEPHKDLLADLLNLIYKKIVKVNLGNKIEPLSVDYDKLKNVNLSKEEYLILEHIEKISRGCDEKFDFKEFEDAVQNQFIEEGFDKENSFTKFLIGFPKVFMYVIRNIAVFTLMVPLIWILGIIYIELTSIASESVVLNAMEGSITKVIYLLAIIINMVAFFKYTKQYGFKQVKGELDRKYQYLLAVDWLLGMNMFYNFSVEDSIFDGITMISLIGYIGLGGFTIIKIMKWLIKRLDNIIKLPMVLSEKGKIEYRKVLKFKYYLEEYTLIKEKEVDYMAILDWYIPYAIAVDTNKGYKKDIEKILKELNIEKIFLDVFKYELRKEYIL